jgi:hypothetical protein
MKRSQVFPRVFVVLTLSILSCLLPLAIAQEALYSQRQGESLYYEPEHFVWLHAENEQLRQEDLLRFLSRQRVVIILEQPDDLQSRNVQTFLENPPATLPAVETFEVLPSSRTDESFTVGYVQDDALNRRLQASRAFATYLVTFQDVLRLERLLRVLDDLAKTPGIDYVLPVFVFPNKLVAPFVQFEVDFLPPELIPGGVEQIRQLNDRSFVKETEPTRNFKEPVVLQLKKDAPTNILATVRRYQHLPWMVQHAKLRWVRLRLPVDVQAHWELPMGIPSFSIWEPMRYMVSIERDHDVELLPKAFTETAVRSWVADNTHLPDELIHVGRIEHTTQSHEDGRMRDEVSFVVRLAKTGTYIFSPYPIQAAYPALNGNRRIEMFRATHPSFLTIPDHLPRQVRQIPGHLITTPEQHAPAWMATTAMLLGTVCLVLGLGWTLRSARRTVGRTPRGREPGPEALQSPLVALLVKYQDRLQELRRQLESLPFQGHMDAERAWLRSLRVLLKRLVGERYGQDETLFLGGLGVSSTSMRHYLFATSVDPDAAPLATVLTLLHALEGQALHKVVSLSKNDAKTLLAQAEAITEDMCR